MTLQCNVISHWLGPYTKWSVYYEVVIYSGLPSVTEFQYLVTEITLLLLKVHFCYWNFHEILTKIPIFVLISQLLPHKNTEICVKLCRNAEIITKWVSRGWQPCLLVVRRSCYEKTNVWNCLTLTLACFSLLWSKLWTFNLLQLCSSLSLTPYKIILLTKDTA